VRRKSPPSTEEFAGTAPDFLRCEAVIVFHTRPFNGMPRPEIDE